MKRIIERRTNPQDQERLEEIQRLIDDNQLNQAERMLLSMKSSEARLMLRRVRQAKARIKRQRQAIILSAIMGIIAIGFLGLVRSNAISNLTAEPTRPYAGIWRDDIFHYYQDDELVRDFVTVCDSETELINCNQFIRTGLYFHRAETLDCIGDWQQGFIGIPAKIDCLNRVVGEDYIAPQNRRLNMPDN